MITLVTPVAVLSGLMMGYLYGLFFKQEIYQRYSHKTVNWITLFSQTFVRHVLFLAVGFFVLREGVAMLITWVGSFLVTFWYCVVATGRGEQ